MRQESTLPEGGHGLRRVLASRHVSMISIGGIIGAGLFVGSSAAIAAAGPAIVVSYVIAGALVLLVMRMLGEMAVALPRITAFSDFARCRPDGHHDGRQPPVDAFLRRVRVLVRADQGRRNRHVHHDGGGLGIRPDLTRRTNLDSSLQWRRLRAARCAGGHGGGHDRVFFADWRGDHGGRSGRIARTVASRGAHVHHRDRPHTHLLRRLDPADRRGGPLAAGRARPVPLHAGDGGDALSLGGSGDDDGDPDRRAVLPELRFLRHLPRAVRNGGQRRCARVTGETEPPWCAHALGATGRSRRTERRRAGDDFAPALAAWSLKRARPGRARA